METSLNENYISPKIVVLDLQVEGCLANSTPGGSEGTGEDEW